MKALLPLLLSLMLATSALAEGRHTKGEKPLAISQGRAVNLADFLVPGKITLFDFTSEYCPPCRAYDDPLLQLHERRADIAVVKVDINRPDRHRIDWDSPVAKQYNIHSIPHFKICGPDGKVIAEDTDDNWPARALLNRWLGALE